MAKKPVRVFKKTHGKMVAVDPKTASSGRNARQAVPVYRDTTDSDRMNITQRVVEHSEITQARMQEGPSRYDALFHSIYDAVFITDADGVIQESNARSEYCFMLSREDMRGMNVIQLISGADGALLNIIRDNVDNKRFTILEAVCLRADGTRFFSEIVVNRLKGGSKNTLCVLIRDATDRKEAEAELSEANQRLLDAQKVQVRMETVSTMFYAMNNPLQILMCMAELDKNKEYKKQVGRIIEVMNELQTATALKPVTDEDGITRYDLPEHRDLEPCDMSRILVVDDEKILRNMFMQALSVVFPKLTIDMAANGQEARDLFDMHHYGLIVMDISMPVMNGEQSFEAIQRVCEQKSWALPPFVFCTGFVVSENLKKIIQDNPIHKHLAKPLEIAELVKVIQSSLAAKE